MKNNTTKKMDIGVRAPKKARARDVGAKPVTTITVKPEVGAALAFPVFAAIKSIYGNERAFYVEKSPQRIVLKLKGERKAHENTKAFTTRMTKVALEYAAEIEQGANAGDADFANPFIDAGFAAITAKRRNIPAPSMKKFAAYQDVIQEIIDSIIDSSGKVIGTLPWQSTYVQYPTMNFFRLYTAHRRRHNNPAQTFTPLMRDLGLRYKGINLMRLLQDFRPKSHGTATGATRDNLPFYVTERQAVSLGGHVLATAKRIGLVFWKMADDPTGTMTREQRMKNGYPIKFSVVRVDAVAGEAFEKKVSAVVTALIAEKPRGDGMATDPAAEAILLAIRQRTPAPKIVVANTETPRFRPSTDEIIMPPRAAFAADSAAGYYTTLFHEITHWTGAASRLARHAQITTARPSARGHEDDTYDKEELVAEMGAYLLSAEAGFAPQTRDNSAAYINSWLRELQDKPFWLSTASRLASEAVEYLLAEYYTSGDYAADTADAIVADSNADAQEYAALLNVVAALSTFMDEIREHAALPTTETLVVRTGTILADGGTYVPRKYREYYVLKGAYMRNWTDVTPAETFAYIRDMAVALNTLLAEIPVPTEDIPIATMVLGKSFGPAAEGAVIWSVGGAAVISKCGATTPVCHHTHAASHLRKWLSTRFQPECNMHLCPSCDDTNA